jgi:hypothetical protein
MRNTRDPQHQLRIDRRKKGLSCPCPVPLKEGLQLRRNAGPEGSSVTCGIHRAKTWCSLRTAKSFRRRPRTHTECAFCAKGAVRWTRSSRVPTTSCERSRRGLDFEIRDRQRPTAPTGNRSEEERAGGRTGRRKNGPEEERAGGRTSRRKNEPEGERAGGRTSRRENEPEGERAGGRRGLQAPVLSRRKRGFSPGEKPVLKILSLPCGKISSYVNEHPPDATSSDHHDDARHPDLSDPVFS